ncbi:MAG: shikimate dehydrogenase [Acidobacteria bacterium]|nr:shikimate dehydrogenase [Acidobacteriota bacterium]
MALPGRVFRAALFGHPVGHSRSAELFRALAAHGGPAVDYQLVDVPLGRLAEFVERLRAGEWDGANVTVPHKLDAARMADTLDAAARGTGAVNVLARDGDRVRGANTDVAGFVGALALPRAADALRGRPRRAAVLGSGGAARAVGWGLAHAGWEIVTVARRAGASFGWDDPGLARAVAACALVVQATSAGMAPAPDEAPPLPAEAFAPGQLAIELIYNPWETRWLRSARARGATAVNGWPMLVGQAARAAETWLGRAAAEAVALAAAAIEPRDPFQPAAAAAGGPPAP